MRFARHFRSVLLLAMAGSGLVLGLPRDPARPTPPVPAWLNTAAEQIERMEYHVTPTADGAQAPNRAQGLRTWFRRDGIELVPRRRGASDAGASDAGASATSATSAGASAAGASAAGATSRAVASSDARIEADSAAPSGAAWRFAWQTVAWGRDGDLETLLEVEPRFEGPRAEYVRPGITEWYENREDGLEQGFTLHARSPGENDLRIEGSIDRSLRAELDAQGQCADFYHAAHGAHVLRYSKLQVWDADGVELSAHLELDDDRLAIVVDDRGAAYPITVDPVFNTPDWSVVDPQAQSQFGAAVQTAGDVNGDGYSDVVVGAWLYDGGQSDEGRAFLYLGSADGLQVAPVWTFEPDQSDAFCGHAVAPAGDVNGDGYDDVLVTAFAFDDDQLDEGRAFVFHGSSSGLGASPDWIADGQQASAWFGYSAGTAGDVNGDGFADVVVGALYHDDGEPNEGRALVYLGSDTGLSTTPAWFVDGNQDGARFGFSVGTAGDVNGDGYADVIVGSQTFDGGHTDEGAAFVYHGSPTGPSATPGWSAEGNQNDAHFGSSVSTAGDVNGDGYADVVIGAPEYDGDWVDGGFLAVYLGSAAGLATFPSFTQESNQEDARLGQSVATAGDVDGDGLADVVAGAPQFDVVQENDGIAFVYKGDVSGSLSQIWSGFSNELGALFGIAVGTAGDVDGDGFSEILVGAGNAGRASVYRGFGGTLSVAVAAPEGDKASAEYGTSVASAGDVNGDGYSDVIVGAHWYDTGFSKQGRAFVYLGSPNGMEPTPAWTADGGGEGWWFAHSVACAGDVNGDGYADVVVGAPYCDDGVVKRGAVFVYHGSPSGLAASPAWQRVGEQPYGRLGWSVASAGDVNGDGFSDLVVGSPAFNDGLPFQGAAWVHHGSPSGVGPVAWSIVGDQANLWTGNSVAGAGDVNGDGYSDVLVGVPGYAQIAPGAGAAHLYLGSSSGLGPIPDWFPQFDQQGAQFGYSLGTAGDVNGDGFSDVIVGALHAVKNQHPNEGMAFVYHGSPSGLGANPDWEEDGDQDSAHYGYSVATAGDVNGDGYSDVIVGALLFEVFQWNEDEGNAFVYLGSSNGLSTSYDVASRLEGGQPGANLGVSVATAGDVNGDGFSDVIVGAFRYDNGQNDEGRVLVHLGNDGDGVDRRPRQLRSDGTGPIAPLGSSDSSSSFMVEGLARSAAGRARVRLAVEAKPLGVPLDATAIRTTPIHDTGDPQLQDGVVISQVMNGLLPESVYRWRFRVESDSPFFPHSPWITLPHNAAGESDLRTPSGPVAAIDPAVAETALWFAPPRPNPFGSSTEIAFALDRSGPVWLDVHDVRGRRVARLTEGHFAAGRHSLRWNGRTSTGRRAAAGVYFLRLDAGYGARTQKVVLVD